MNRNTFLPGNTFGRGRPKGSPNRSTRAAQRLLREHEAVLMRTCLAKALRGELRPLLWLLSRVPWQGPAARKLKLPPIDTTAGIIEAHAVVVQALASGGRTAAEGQALASMLEGGQRLIEKRDIEARLQELERQLKQPESQKSPL
jgi:hypothetical protein